MLHLLCVRFPRQQQTRLSSPPHLQRSLDFSNDAAVSQCACLTPPRPVEPPCELPANLVRVVDPMMSSNPPSISAMLAHACKPLVIRFDTRPTPSFHRADRRCRLRREL